MNSESRTERLIKGEAGIWYVSQVLI